MIGCTVDNIAHHGIVCEVSKKTGGSVFSIVYLSVSTQEQQSRSQIKLNKFVSVFRGLYGHKLMKVSDEDITEWWCTIDY